MRRLLPSPAMVVALVALMCSLGGTAIAAGTGLITGAQIKDHSIGLADISNTAVAKLHGQVGPAGPAGVPGPIGPVGPVGPAGGFNPAKVQIVQGAQITASPGQIVTPTVTCPTGTVMVGGGGYGSIGRIALSGPGANGVAGWTIIVLNDTSIVLDKIQAFVECAAP